MSWASLLLLPPLLSTPGAPSAGGSPQSRRVGPGDSSVVWSLEGDIRFAYPTFLTGDRRSLVIVGTNGGLEAVDGGTGATVWRRSNLKNVGAQMVSFFPDTELALLDMGRGDEVISLRSGHALWNSQSLPLRDIKLYLPIPGQARMLVLGRDSSGARTVLNVGMADGVVSWARRNVWRHDPQCSGVLPRIQRSAIYPPPLADTDSTLIVWLTDEGPFRLNLATGELMWAASELANYSVPSPAQGCLLKSVSPWITHRGIVYTPVGSKNWAASNLLVAIDVHSGTLRWRAETVPGLTAITIADSSSLFIQGWDEEGSAFLDRLAMSDGRSLWTRPVTGLRHASSIFRGANGGVFLVADSKVVGVSLRDGTRSERDTLRFGSGEVPGLFSRLSEMVVLVSEQNLAAVDSSGAVQYQARFPNPVKESRRKWLAVTHSAGIIAVAASIPAAFSSDPAKQNELQLTLGSLELVEAQQREMAVEIGLTNVTERSAFFCTRQSGEAGTDQWSLRQVKLHDGVDVARYPLRGMPSRLMLDEDVGLMYAVYHGSRLDAIRVRVQ